MMRHRVNLLLIWVNLAAAAWNLTERQWPYVLIGLLGAYIVYQGMRIDRLQDEITILRINRLFDREDIGGDAP